MSPRPRSPVPTPLWPPLIVVGLTGGIASGKSTVAGFFAEAGATVLNADQEGHAAVAAGEPALAELVAAFGPEYLRQDGQLDRPALGRRIFADAEARRILNRITHPRIAARLQERLRTLAAAPPSPPLVIVEAALLLDANWSRFVDRIVVVDTQPKTQVGRLTARLGLGVPEARQRLEAQLPRETRLQSADYVISGEIPLDEARAQVRLLTRDLLAVFSR